MARIYEKVKQDKNGEKVIHEFLKKHFYTNCENLVEITDKELQIKGNDVSFKLKNKLYICDEKAALDYVNNLKGYRLSTFCLELSFLNTRDEEMEGWLTKDTQTNNAYVFVWLDKAKKDVIDSPDDILEAEISLVYKQDIIDYLNNLGWTKNALREKSRRIRHENDTNFGDYKTNGCKFSYAKYLPEKPINILLKREVYNNFPNTINKKYKSI